MAEEVYAPIIDTQVTLQDALFQVCKISSSNNSLTKGLRQVTKRILQNKAKLILLSKKCESSMLNLVVALAKNANVPVIKLESHEELGKLVGFDRIRNGEVVKPGKCGVACVVDYCEMSEGRLFVENALRDGIN